MNIKKYFYDQGAGTYLALAFAMLSAILTLVLVQFIGAAATEQVKSNIGHGLAELAFQTSDKMDRHMFERYREVRLMAGRAELASDGTAIDAKRRMLETLGEAYPSYVWIGLATPDGKVSVAAKGLMEGADVSKQPWFQNAFKSISLGDVHEDKLFAKRLPAQANQPDRFVDIAFPYTDTHGKVAGVLGARLSLAWAGDVEKSIVERTSTRLHAESVIARADGTVLLGPPGLPGTSIALESFNAARDRTGFLTEDWPDGQTYLVGFSKNKAYEKYPGLGWTVLVRQNIKDVLAPVKRIQQQVLWIGIGIAALFSLLGVVAARRITHPLSALTQSVQRIHDSDTVQPPPRSGGYREVDALTGSVNALITDLIQKKNALNALNLALEKRVAERTRELEPALDRVRSNETRIQAIIDLAQDAYIAVDRTGHVTDWNSQAEKMFGWRKHEAIGCALATLLLPERFLEGYQLAMSNYREAGRLDFLNRRMEHIVVNRQGEEFPIEVTIGLVNTDDTYFFSAFVHDMSERKKIERMKNEFISTVSHELRTPLTSIRASLSMLASDMAGDAPSDTKTLLDIAYNGCERLVRLVNDVLDIEKIESGNMPFDMVEQPLHPLILQAVADMQGYASQYQVEIVASDDAGLCAKVDRDRMVQVLTNLLSNAIKFSMPAGTVDVHVQREGEHVRISVVDHGNGIPDAFRDRVFEKFAQADSTDSRKKGGTGLGLSICKSIVEEHGGTIGFVSEEGNGTSFHVDLPAVSMTMENAA